MRVESFEHHNFGQEGGRRFSDRTLNDGRTALAESTAWHAAKNGALPVLAAGLMAIAVPGAVLSLLFGASTHPFHTLDASNANRYDLRPTSVQSEERADAWGVNASSYRIVCDTQASARATTQRKRGSASLPKSSTVSVRTTQRNAARTQSLAYSASDTIADIVTEIGMISPPDAQAPQELEGHFLGGDERSHAIVAYPDKQDASMSGTPLADDTGTPPLLTTEEAAELDPRKIAVPPAADTSLEKDGWPSKNDSAFNYARPTSTWASNPKMGAGEFYPNINKKAVSASDATQGVAGPEASFSFAYPLKRMTVTSYFGWRKSYGRIHYGIDLRASMDTPVYASARGTVTWYTKPKGTGTYGRVIELNHGEGFTTVYAHLNSVSVSSGDHVEKGDLIGYSGKTGANAPHLHFEIRHKGIPYNPFMGYLKLPN